MNRKETITGANVLLLVLVFVAIFMIPLLPLTLHRLLYHILYTAIFVTALVVIEKHRKMLVLMVLIVTGAEWIADFLQMPVMTGFSNLLNIALFVVIVIRLIIQIARSKHVTLLVILQAINGYLLLGMVFSILVALVTLIRPDAYSFPSSATALGQSVASFSDYLYYGFVTFTTLGYGDIVPRLPYAKSLALLTSVSGQIYLAVIIAMLVGKFASSPSRQK